MKLPRWLCRRTPYFGQGQHGIGHPMSSIGRTPIADIFTMTCTRCGHVTEIDLRQNKSAFRSA